MPAFYKIGIALLVVFSSACSNGTTLPAPPTASSEPALTPTPSPTTLPNTPTLVLTPDTLTPGTLLPGTSLCSPLAVLALDEIPTFITQPFIAPASRHDAEHPEWVRKDDGHHGVDIGYYKRDGELFTGTPVLAALDGKIAAIVRDRPPYGNMLMVETPLERTPAPLRENTGDSLYTLYAHLQNLQPLTIGQPVVCGQQLAETGLTGFTGGPHLHFETRWGPPGETFDSMAYYRADASADELANYERWRMSAVFHLFDPMQLLEHGE
jgi:murein DD-endopeptidase MepM/ murein hydrolase activator NlpD